MAKTATSKRIKVEYVALGSLHPAPYNPRTISDAELAKLERSMDAFGVVDPIIARRADGMVIGGHQRLEAARRKGIAEVPVVWLDDLSDAQAKSLNLALNRISGEWDMPKLGALLEEMSDMPELDLSGFDTPEMSRAITAFRTEQGGLTDDDAIPEAPEPTTKLGDLWLLGDHRLLCGDATKAEDVERLMDGAKATMVMADPPYNVNYQGGTSSINGVKTRKRSDAYADRFVDYHGWLATVLTNANAASDRSAALHLWHSSSEARAVLGALDDSSWVDRSMIVWNKGSIKGGLGQTSKQYRTAFEPMLYCHKKGKAPRWYGPGNESEMWDEAGPAANPLHPTMKPVALYERSLTNHSEVGGAILECFLGSGTTLIACEKLGRRCYGMEIEPRYVDVAVRRWEEYTGREAKREAA